MHGWIRPAQALAAALLLSLAGCGGGGGVSSTPAPTPSPSPTPTPTPSPTPTPTPTPSPAPPPDRLQEISISNASGSFRYDAASKTYTLTIPSGSASQQVSFGPSDIDLLRSNAQFTYYSRISSVTSRQFLTITNPGLSGRFTYRYVGSALLRSDTATTGTTIDSTLSAFTFGFPTDQFASDPAARVPTTGTARFDIDVIGHAKASGNVIDITGSGTMVVDFGKSGISLVATTNGLTSSSALLLADGFLVFNGGYNGRPSQYPALQGNASFAEGATTLTGGFDGLFYGPGAVEVGANWGASGSGTEIAGTVMGRKTGEQPTVSSFDDQANPLQIYLSSNIGSITYDPVNQRYAVTTGYPNSFNPQTYRASGSAAFGPSGSAQVTFHRGSGTPLSWLRSVEVPSASFPWASHGLFGYLTADAAVPHTGTAAYSLDIYGMLGTDAGLSGTASLKADLSAGTYLLAGSATATKAGSPPDVATVFGRGGIASSGNLLDISPDGLEFNFATAGTFKGSGNGQFYGPAAEELGFIFYAGDLRGSMIGRRTSYDPSTVVPPVSGSAYGSSGYATWLHSPALGTPANFLSASSNPAGSQAPAFAWDPATAQFTVTPANPDGDPAAPFVVGTAQRDAAASSADFDVYRTTQGGTAYEVKVLRHDNTRIAMTYAGFAGVTARLAGADAAASADDHDDLGFAVLDYRNVTPVVPVTGAGVYVGKLFGSGIQNRDNLSKVYYALTGSSEFRMDFSKAVFSGSLAISGTDTKSGQPFDFGTYAWNGTIAGSGFDATGFGGALHGSFFGPAAQEVGGVFATDQTGPGIRTSLEGVFLAK